MERTLWKPVRCKFIMYWHKRIVSRRAPSPQYLIFNACVVSLIFTLRQASRKGFCSRLAQSLIWLTTLQRTAEAPVLSFRLDCDNAKRHTKVSSDVICRSRRIEWYGISHNIKKSLPNSSISLYKSSIGRLTIIAPFCFFAKLNDAYNESFSAAINVRTRVNENFILASENEPCGTTFDGRLHWKTCIIHLLLCSIPLEIFDIIRKTITDIANLNTMLLPEGLTYNQCTHLWYHLLCFSLYYTIHITSNRQINKANVCRLVLRVVTMTPMFILYFSTSMFLNVVAGRPFKRPSQVTYIYIYMSSTNNDSRTSKGLAVRIDISYCYITLGLFLEPDTLSLWLT